MFCVWIKKELIDEEIKSWIDNQTYRDFKYGLRSFGIILNERYGHYSMTANQVLSYFDYILVENGGSVRSYNDILQNFYAHLIKPFNKKNLNGKPTEKESFFAQIKNKPYYRSLLEYAKNCKSQSLFDEISRMCGKDGVKI